VNDPTIQAHCGAYAASPPAPPELCAQVNHVPEPSTIALMILAALIIYIMRRKK
jgi:hypothetical protein